MSINRYTIVVSSCDNYEDLWDPFFRILKEEWPFIETEQTPIILNTESKEYHYDGLNLKTLQLFSAGDNPSWTERLRDTLKTVETEYVIHLLDDFFLNDKVRSDVIDKCVNWMDENRRISMFCFKETFVSTNIRDDKYKGFERRPLFGQYKFNCQAALWRKDRLISYLKKDEDPWEWEVLGNWRSYRHPFHLFYSHIPGEKRVFPYIYEDEESGGTFWESGVYRGKWVLPSVVPVFEKHNISIDYSKRGVILQDEFDCTNKVIPKKNKADAPKLKRIFWCVRPLYCMTKEIVTSVKYFLSHIEHFF